MKRFYLSIPLLFLAGCTRSWAAPDAGLISMDNSALYLALIVAFLGMTVGVFASTKRGLNIFRAAIGGLFLGPFAFLLFFISARVSCSERGVKWLLCGGWMSSEDAVCGGGGYRDIKNETGIPEADQKPPLPKATPTQKAKAAAPTDLSSLEFAQYSEMLRRTMPGAFIRQYPIEYAAKLGEESVIRCSNPDCNRILPPPHHTCPHCGTAHA